MKSDPRAMTEKFIKSYLEDIRFNDVTRFVTSNEDAETVLDMLEKCRIEIKWKA